MYGIRPVPCGMAIIFRLFFFRGVTQAVGMKFCTVLFCSSRIAVHPTLLSQALTTRRVYLAASQTEVSNMSLTFEYVAIADRDIPFQHKP